MCMCVIHRDVIGWLKSESYCCYANRVNTLFPYPIPTAIDTGQLDFLLLIQAREKYNPEEASISCVCVWPTEMSTDYTVTRPGCKLLGFVCNPIEHVRRGKMTHTHNIFSQNRRVSLVINDILCDEKRVCVCAGVGVGVCVCVFRGFVLKGAACNYKFRNIKNVH